MFYKNKNIYPLAYKIHINLIKLRILSQIISRCYLEVTNICKVINCVFCSKSDKLSSNPKCVHPDKYPFCHQGICLL